MGSVLMRSITDLIVIHTSATRANMDIGAKEIRSWHKARGWKDIGYHYVIRRDGTYERGRARNAVGAHVAGYNSRSVGICLVGGLSNTTGKPENNYTDAQWTTLRTLVATMVEAYPDAVVCGHRDLSPDTNQNSLIEEDEWLKACPCFSARNWAHENGFPIDRTFRVSDDNFTLEGTPPLVTVDNRETVTEPVVIERPVDRPVEVIVEKPVIKRPTTLCQAISWWWKSRKD